MVVFSVPPSLQIKNLSVAGAVFSTQFDLCILEVRYSINKRNLLSRWGHVVPLTRESLFALQLRRSRRNSGYV